MFPLREVPQGRRRARLRRRAQPRRDRQAVHEQVDAARFLARCDDDRVLRPAVWKPERPAVTAQRGSLDDALDSVERDDERLAAVLDRHDTDPAADFDLDAHAAI